MKCLASLSATAGLICCLAASPAFADAVTPGPVPGLSSSDIQVLDALQALNATIADASAITSSSVVASTFNSGGPSTAPTTTQGVDSSPSFVTGTSSLTSVALANLAPAGYSATASTSDVPAAAPNAQAVGGTAVYVGSGVAVTPSDTSIISTSAGAAYPVTINPQQITAASTSPVPAPPSLFLMAAGLLAFVPFRRGSSRYA